MSIDRCSRCGDLVDTDADCEAYVEVTADVKGNPDYICLCPSCREQWELEHPEPPYPADLDARIAAQIAADPRYGCEKCDWDVDGCSPCPEHADS